MSGLEGAAMFECVESSFVFNRFVRGRSVEAPRLWQRMATQSLAYVEEEWMKKQWVSSWTLKMKEHIKYAVLCGLTTFESCRIQKKI